MIRFAFLHHTNLASDQYFVNKEEKKKHTASVQRKLKLIGTIVVKSQQKLVHSQWRLNRTWKSRKITKVPIVRRVFCAIAYVCIRKNSLHSLKNPSSRKRILDLRGNWKLEITRHFENVSPNNRTFQVLKRVLESCRDFKTPPISNVFQCANVEHVDKWPMTSSTPVTNDSPFTEI